MILLQTTIITSWQDHWQSDECRGSKLLKEQLESSVFFNVINQSFF